MKQAKSMNPKRIVSPRNRHLVRMYPFSAPRIVESATAGTTIEIEFQK